MSIYVAEKLGISKKDLPKVYYHLSTVPNLNVLKPLSTKNSNDRPGKNKLSLAPTIHGCVHGLVLPGYKVKYSKEYLMSHLDASKRTDKIYSFYLYGVNTDKLDGRSVLETTYNDNYGAVFDLDVTQELSYMKEVDCEFLGEVVVEMLSAQKAKKNFAYQDLPVVTWCTIPGKSYWTLSILDFKLSSKDEKIASSLDSDLELFKSGLIRAFEKYVTYIQNNTKETLSTYNAAINYLR